MLDKAVDSYIKKELIRQNEGIELIASENFPSEDVREAQGSIFTCKYAEGYPAHRYYGGCENVDAVETLAIERAKRLFEAKYVNVQPHSGSQANFAAYHAVLKPGDKILSLCLNDGGHLTHGAPVSFSSHMYSFSHYDLGDDGRLDYDIIKERIEETDPDLFLAGYSAYPYEIDFKRMREIIDEYNKANNKACLFMVDMAHIAGIVAAKLCQNPVLYADIVTTTTHKTLRGPRGGMILSRHEDWAKKINSSVFPYSQGGPLEHVIAGKAICFNEDLQPEFVDYIKKVLANTKAADEEFLRLGATASGTENHLFIVNTMATFGITGKEAEHRLQDILITSNKETIHGETLSPAETSGIRLGFAAATTRGCTEEEARHIAGIIFEDLKSKEPDVKKLQAEVKAITRDWKDISLLTFPVHQIY